MDAYIEVLEGRKNLYLLAARSLMIEVDETLLELIKTNSTIAEFFPNFASEELKNEDTKRLIEEILNVDFVDISLVGLTPYESFYLRDDGMIDSTASNPVMQFYDRYGFTIDLSKSRTVSADHIGIQLEFMATLISKEIDAVKNGDMDYARDILSIQSDFMKNHILRWSHIYLSKVIDEASTLFYTDVAGFTISLLFSDYDYIVEELES